jgi:cytochrome c oxidase subunit III
MLKLFSKTYKYLDSAQHKRTNAGTLIVLLCFTIVIFYIPLLIKLFQARKLFAGYVPAEFNLAAIAILGSSWLLHHCHLLKEKDKAIPFKLVYFAALVLGTLFVFLQYSGWKYLHGLSVTSSTKILLVMILMHAIHFMIAWFMLMILFIQFSKVKTAADVYIFFLDRKKRSTFSTFRTYWDFLGFLWLFLYCIMLIKMI